MQVSDRIQPRRRSPLSERLWSKVDRRGPDECWPWIAKSKHHFGYGKLRGSAGDLRAHRVAYELTYGSIPDGLNVLHHCDNPPCCNPNHLFLGTKKDNTHDMIRKGRWYPVIAGYGEDHSRAKLNEEQVRAILSSNLSGATLAKKFGVTKMAISLLRRGKTWRNLHE